MQKLTTTNYIKQLRKKVAVIQNKIQKNLCGNLNVTYF